MNICSAISTRRPRIIALGDHFDTIYIYLRPYLLSDKTYSTTIHVKISQLLSSNLQTSRQQVVFARLVTSCQQVWNKVLTTSII